MKKNENPGNVNSTQGKAPLRVEPPNFGTVTVRVFNTEGSELVTHKLGEDADISNPDIVTRKRGEARPTRDKMEEMLHAFYEIPGETNVENLLKGKKGVIGLPASGFHKGMMTLAKDSGDRTTLNGSLIGRNVFVFADVGRYVRVNVPKGCYMREDIVKIGKGMNRSPSMRYRPGFPQWEATLRIRFDADVLSAEDVVNLLARTGQKIGQCELRPEKGYSCGMYEVDYDSIKISLNTQKKAA